MGTKFKFKKFTVSNYSRTIYFIYDIDSNLKENILANYQNKVNRVFLKYETSLV